MAAARHPIYLLLLLAHLPPGGRAQDRRFSELKRCADPECSMLMARGKALKDFTGPDCRFLNFKKDESIYVYHKLSGRTTDLWAGTVGAHFGYFPKHLVDIKQVYVTDDKEIEQPTDETDFVCFDGGTDNFDNYNVDELLNKPKASTSRQESSDKKVQPEDQPSEEKETSQQNQEGEIKRDQKDQDQTGEKAEDKPETDADLTKDKPEESTIATKDESVEEMSVDSLNVNSESELTQEDKVALQPEVPGIAKNDSISQGESTGADEKSKTIDAYTLLEEDMLQGLKTNIGSSDDAVVSDDEETRQVTLNDGYKEEEIEEPSDSHANSQDQTEKLDGPPLLSYEEIDVNPADQMVSFDNESLPPAQSEVKPVMPEEEVNVAVDVGHATSLKPEKDILTSWGDTFFAIVSGGEHTKEVSDLDGTDSEEEDEDDFIPESPELEDENLYLIGMEKDRLGQNKNIEYLNNNDDFFLTKEDYDQSAEETISDIKDKESLTIDEKLNSTGDTSAEKMTPLSNDSTPSVAENDAESELLTEKQDLFEHHLEKSGATEAVDEGGKEDEKPLLKDEAVPDNIDGKEDKIGAGEQDYVEINDEYQDLKGEQGKALSGIENVTDTVESEVEKDQHQGSLHTEDDRLSLSTQDSRLENVDLPSADSEKKEVAQAEESNINQDSVNTEAPEDKDVKPEEPLAGNEEAQTNLVKTETDSPDPSLLNDAKHTSEGSTDELSSSSQNTESESPSSEQEKTAKAEVPAEESPSRTSEENSGTAEISLNKESDEDVNTPLSSEESNLSLQTDVESKSAEAENANNSDSEQNKLDNIEPKLEAEDDIRLLNGANAQVTEDDVTEPKQSQEDKFSANVEVPLGSELADEEREEKEDLDEEVGLLEDENAKKAMQSRRLLEQKSSAQEENEPLQEAVAEKTDPENKVPMEDTTDGSNIAETKEAETNEEKEYSKTEDVGDVHEPLEKEGKMSEQNLLDADSLDKIIEIPDQEPTKGPIIPEEKSQKHISEPEHEKKSHLEQETVDETLPDDPMLAGNNTETEEPEPEEPSYIKSITELSIMREYLDEPNIEQFRKYLTSENVFRVEAMFQDMETELKLARKGNVRQDYIDKALDQILESTETNILDFVERILDAREVSDEDMLATEKQMFDEEAMLLEDIQEVAYRLRQKYSTYSDSSLLAPEHEVPEPTEKAEEEDKQQSSIDSDIAQDAPDTLEPAPQLDTEDGEEDAANVPNKALEPPFKVDEVKVENAGLPESPEAPVDSTISEEPVTDNLPGSNDNNIAQDIPELPEPVPKLDAEDTREEDAANVPNQALEPPFKVGEVEVENAGPTETSQAPLASAVSEEPKSHGKEEPVTDTMLEDGTEVEKKDEKTTNYVTQIVSSMGDALQTTRQSLGPVAGALISALPEDLRPGEDFHGVQWEAVIITALVGIITLLIFFWRTCLSVKSRMYQVNEKQLADKIANLMKEKSEALEKISEYERKIKEAKETETTTQKKSSNLLTEAEALRATIKELKNSNKTLDSKMKNLVNELECQKQENKKKQEMVSDNQKSVKQLEEQLEQHTAELSELQFALNEAKLREHKARSDLRSMQEENTRLKERKEQLLKEAEGWSERQRELDEQIQLQQKSHKDLEEALAYKENEIEVLTNCIMQLKELEEASAGDDNRQVEGDGELANGELPDKRKEKMKVQIKQMMDVSRVKTTLSIIEEEKDLYQRKLHDEVSARHELEEQIKQLQHDSSTSESEKNRLDSECRTLRQKVEILTELYQQKEMALHKKLTQEEYERQEKEQKLSMADEKAVLASEEVKIYKQRIQEMEEELQKTEKSFKNQIASHEKKAHENWLIARTAERTLAEEKRECANLRQKLIEVNQRIAALQRPSIVKPTPGRPDHQPPVRRGALSRDGSFGPSPVSGGAPSPPMMMEAPGRSASANLSRSDSLKGDSGVMDVPGGLRRPPTDVSGRTSAPVDLGHSVLNAGPRTSSPAVSVDGAPGQPHESEPSGTPASPPSPEPAQQVISGAKGPPSFPGTPVMNSPAAAPLMSQPPARLIGQPPPRGPFGPRPLPPQQLRGPSPGMRDFPPRPLLPPGPIPPDPRSFVRAPLGPRDYPPGPVPFPGGRDYPILPPGARDFPPGPPPLLARDFPPGPPPPGARDFPPGPPPPGARDFPRGPPPLGARDFLSGPPPMGVRDFPLPPPGARDFSAGPPHLGPRVIREGPPPPGSRENIPDLPQGARDFAPGPTASGARDFPPGPHPGSFQGPSVPEPRSLPPGHHQYPQTDRQ